jgi:signal peptidase I
VTGYLLVASACLAGAAAVGARRLRRKIAVVTVRGLSMQPALNAGDRLLIRRVRADRLRTGQIVVIERPDAGGASPGRPQSWPPAGHDWLIKRLAALPGEPTPDLMLEATAPGTESVVPAGKLVVLGDNLPVSLDSRELGYIPAERVLGVMLRALPG